MFDFKFPNIDVNFPTYDDDCPAVEICPYPKRRCYEGTPILEARCSGPEIQSVLNSQNKQPPMINNNTFNAPITQLSQGNNNTQTITNEIPAEMLLELFNLLNSKETDKKGWIEWLTKASDIVGGLSSVVEFISKLQ